MSLTARLFLLVGILLFSPSDGTAQETVPYAPAPAEAATLTPELQAEIDALLELTLPQQKQRARELVREHPDTELARIAQRLLDEYRRFDALDEQERQARHARAAWGREYWRSRCCPMPVWNPPVGRIVNETGEPVLYEQRIEGIYHTLWEGPYRLRAGSDHESPHPFFVRYLTPAGVQTMSIVPGSAYAFRGSADDGTLTLVPAGNTLAPPPGAVVLPPVAEPGPGEGPMILP